ncbi:MAG: hypothetical protein PHO66_00250, partial [Eubacteriales bacterium]|nr:hypothetical protein [Eubacteriales bacterium]
GGTAGQPDGRWFCCNGTPRPWRITAFAALRPVRKCILGARPARIAAAITPYANFTGQHSVAGKPLTAPPHRIRPPGRPFCRVHPSTQRLNRLLDYQKIFYIYQENSIKIIKNNRFVSIIF